MRFRVTCTACGHWEETGNDDLVDELGDFNPNPELIATLRASTRSGNCRACGHNAVLVDQA
mgnify:CR=1 FL=1